MVDFDKQKSRRIRDLLYLEQRLVHAVHEEIEETLRDRPSDIIDRLRYILDESVLCDSTNTLRKVGHTNSDDVINNIIKGKGLKPLSNKE